MKIGVIGRGIILEKFKKYNFDVIDLNSIDLLGGTGELEYKLQEFKDKSHIILCPTFTNITETKSFNHAGIMYQNYILPTKIIGLINSFKAKLIAISSCDLYNSRDKKAINTTELRGLNVYYASKMIYDYFIQDECDLVIRHGELLDDTKSIENIIYRVGISKYTISDSVNLTTVDDLVCFTVSAIKKDMVGVLNVASPETISEYNIASTIGYRTIPMSLLEWSDELNEHRQMSLVDCSKVGYIHEPRVITFELIIDYLSKVAYE